MKQHSEIMATRPQRASCVNAAGDSADVVSAFLLNIFILFSIHFASAV